MTTPSRSAFRRPLNSEICVGPENACPHSIGSNQIAITGDVHMATRAREIVFIDPSVTDIPVLVAGLRPGVVPVLLGGVTPAAQEIAQVLRGCEGLDAIHIVAH